MFLSNTKRQKLPIGGVDFDFITLAQAPDVIQSWRRAGRRGCVTLVNPHSVMMCRRDERLREATRSSDLTLPDGVGIVLAARLLGYGRRHRVTGPALMLGVCDAGRKSGLRHYFYGGREGVAEELARRLSETYPGMIVAGTHCPPFHEMTPEEDARVVAEINAARPDVVWVGIGAPKQEKWMADHQFRVRSSAMIGVGAAFDFHSGNVQWAPSWVRRFGCEWAYRLLLEPKRMWRRNLDSPLFLGVVLIQAVSARLAKAIRRVKTAADVVHFDDTPGGNGGASIKTTRLPRVSDADRTPAAIAS